MIVIRKATIIRANILYSNESRQIHIIQELAQPARTQIKVRKTPAVKPLQNTPYRLTRPQLKNIAFPQPKVLHGQIKRHHLPQNEPQG